MWPVVTPWQGRGSQGFEGLTAQQLRKPVGLSEPGLGRVVHLKIRLQESLLSVGGQWILHVCDLKVCFYESA